MMNVTPGFLSQVYCKIREAESVLGPLTYGQKADLIIDNFRSVRSSDDAHDILYCIYGIQPPPRTEDVIDALKDSLKGERQ